MQDRLSFDFPVLPLPGNDAPLRLVTKIGVLPFVPGPSFKVMLMKPRAQGKAEGPPRFQIAKGTRQININGNWCDMREEDLLHADPSFYESLVATGLREGREEIGLKKKNVKCFYDAGIYSFTSASKREVKKYLHMFAALLYKSDDFAAFEESTADARWLTPEEFREAGRADHVDIAEHIIANLKALHFSDAS